MRRSLDPHNLDGRAVTSFEIEATQARLVDRGARDGAIGPLNRDGVVHENFSTALAIETQANTGVLPAKIVQ